MDFQPEQQSAAYDVPFFENARASDGWEGQATTKTIKQLETELTSAITRLNGGVTSIVWGKFNDGKNEREGCRIEFILRRDNGLVDSARIDLASLPCRDPNKPTPYRKFKNSDASKRMMLYMATQAFKGLWFMRMLAPGLVPLMPFLLIKDAQGKAQTLSELYAAQGMFSKLLPSPKADFVEGEVIEIKTK